MWALSYNVGGPNTSHLKDIFDGVQDNLRCNPTTEIPTVMSPSTSINCINRPALPYGCASIMSGLGYCSKCLDGFILKIIWPNNSLPSFSCGLHCDDGFY